MNPSRTVMNLSEHPYTRVEIRFRNGKRFCGCITRGPLGCLFFSESAVIQRAICQRGFLQSARLPRPLAAPSEPPSPCLGRVDFLIRIKHHLLIMSPEGDSSQLVSRTDRRIERVSRVATNPHPSVRPSVRPSSIGCPLH